MTTDTGERTVTMTVKEAAKQAKRGEHPADYKLTVKSDWFQSQQPTVIFVPLDVGARIEPGDSLTMVVRSKGIKDHGDEPYDGQKPWMHHWAYVRLAGTGNGAVPAAEPAPAPSPEQRKAAALAPDPRGNSIERQVAAKAATDIIAAFAARTNDVGGDAREVWDNWFDHILGRIQGTTAPDTEPGHLVRAAMAMGAQEPEPSAAEIDEQASMPGTTVDDLPF